MLTSNLVYLRKSKDLTQAQIAEFIGITGNTRWSDYERGKSTPPIEILVKISEKFKISIDDLIKIDISKATFFENEFIEEIKSERNLISNRIGNLIDKAKQSVNFSGNSDQLALLDSNMVQIPITDISVAAGTGVFNSDYMENVAHFSFPNHLLKRGATYLSVRIRGASMAPTLQDGGYMAIRLIERTEWANIADERVFVVCDTEGKSYLKRIKNRFKKGFIVLMSDSPDKASYPNFNLQADEIQSIWEAEFYISAKMPNIHSQYYSRLAQLEDKVDDLLKLLPKIEQ